MNNVADVIVIGGGIAGIVASLELLDRGRSVCLVERTGGSGFGGLAAWAFGGIFIVDSPIQRKMGMQDSPAIALTDWCSAAEFTPNDA